MDRPVNALRPLHSPFIAFVFRAISFPPNDALLRQNDLHAGRVFVRVMASRPNH